MVQDKEEKPLIIWYIQTLEFETIRLVYMGIRNRSLVKLLAGIHDDQMFNEIGGICNESIVGERKSS